VLTIQNLHKAFGAQVIFDGATLQMNAGDRFALMGPNGAGKSTLFRLILGEQKPDAGTIGLPRGLTVGHLPQETADFGAGSVLAEALDGADAGDRDIATAKKILMGLGFRVADFDRPVGELSGGWRMRAAIARLLARRPDLMLLDEPTNHLDLESLLWFQNYLRQWKGSILFISHDRSFVNALAGAIVDLRDHRLARTWGDYEKFTALRRQEEERRLAAFKQQEREIEDAETFIARFRAQASKAPQVQSRIKMLEKMVRIEIPPEAKKVKIRFPQPARSALRALVLNNVHKSYGPVTVYSGLDFALERGQKTALVGPNGAGKSTLLKILAGVVPIDSGERVLGLNAHVGYFAQHRVEMLRPDRTVLEEANDTRRLNPDLMVRTILGTFLFPGDAVYKRVQVLSGGEKSRLALVKLLLDPPNALLLDEPTTHLDMASVEALVEALKEYEGTLCCISHDLYFINALADHVAHVEGGRVTLYPGNYAYFQRRRSAPETTAADVSDVPESPAAPPPSAPTAASSADYRRFQEAERARTKARKKINARLRAIAREMTALQAEMGSVFVSSDYRKLMELDGAVKALETEKSRLAAQLD
jgi:ATP-binding cassette subfamily F protein 3